MTDETPAVDYERPVPRDARSPGHAAQVRVQNRRREYLQRHPEYYESLDHELADAVLYERLVKRFQSASERTAEGKAKGYGRTLEASLLRGENKLADLAEAKGATASMYAGRFGGGADQAMDNAWDATPQDKQEGLDLWKAYLEDRFVKGGDEEFEYDKIDGDEDLDSLERQGDEDKWYEDEEPSWVEDRVVDGKKGQTGVQDY